MASSGTVRTNGQGGSSAGVRIASAPMLAIRAFAAYFRAPRGEMPPYTAKVMPDENVADSCAYLAAIPAPAAVDSIPLLEVGA